MWLGKRVKYHEIRDASLVDANKTRSLPLGLINRVRLEYHKNLI